MEHVKHRPLHVAGEAGSTKRAGKGMLTVPGLVFIGVGGIIGAGAHMQDFYKDGCITSPA